VVYSSRSYSCALARIKVILVLSQCIGSILYYIGNNTSYIARVYGEELHCSDTCWRMLTAVAMISLGSSLAYFHLVPPCLHHIAKQYQYEDRHSDTFSLPAMAAVSIKVDALLNTVNLAAEEVGSGCNAFTLILTTAFILVCTALGIGLMVSHFTCSLVMLKKNYGNLQARAQLVPVSSFVVLLICFPTYLLIDNQQPLDCAFGCGSETFARGNFTDGNPNDCNTTGLSALRLTLSIVTFIGIVFVSFLLLHFNKRHT